MKFLAALVSSLVANCCFSQCALLKYISDTVNFEGITVIYYQKDSSVVVKVVDGSFERELPKKYYLDCNTRYMPSVWEPAWKNEKYIAFYRSGGTSVTDEIMMPLNNKDSILQGGDFIIDTARTLYMSLFRDSAHRHPLLLLQNFETGDTQLVRLERSLFWRTILLEQLNYGTRHPKGFHYRDGYLILYVDVEEENPKKLRIKVKI